MHDLLEYSDNCCMPSGSLWNYYRDEVNNAANEIVANYKINYSETSFEYKTKNNKDHTS